MFHMLRGSYASEYSKYKNNASSDGKLPTTQHFCSGFDSPGKKVAAGILLRERNGSESQLEQPQSRRG